ncbi:hypothetical protein [Egbenema bharatensis]|uniref:hypothetical protein n=1 Tax=Egbenema bharatensis TaxID=3463334 RepID=UPI003A87E8A3
MNRWILGSGAIVTSAVTLYSWNPSFVQIDDLEEGNQAAGSNPSEFSDSSRSRDKQGIHRIPVISHTLELLSFDRQWSRNATDRLPRSMEMMYRDRLKQAQSAAEEGDFTEAVTLVSGVPKNSQHYELAQQLQNDWSQELLQQATKLYQQADLVGALTILQSIPSTCDQSDRATSLRERWGQQAVLLERTIVAYRAGEWDRAIESVRALENTPLYHSVLVQDILQESISNRLRPDERLMQIASANLPTASAIPTTLPAPTSYPAPPALEPMATPLSPQLPVDVSRALEWSSPPPAICFGGNADRRSL